MVSKGPDSSSRRTSRIVLAGQITVCERILAATETASRALDVVDIDAFEAAIREREAALEDLTRLPNAPGTESSAPVQAEELQPLADRLQALIREIEAADAAAQRKGASLTESVRKQLAGLTSGSRILRGYRATGQPAPRFTDRKG